MGIQRLGKARQVSPNHRQFFTHLLKVQLEEAAVAFKQWLR